MTLGRQPITIVEIDVDQCTRTYGSAPCTAALGTTTPRKCFNTFRTCQDVENFAAGTLTLRFAENVSGLPKVGTIFPRLVSVSERPGEINLSGIDPKTSALGKRARVTVELDDFTDADRVTDPYQAERVSGAAQFSGVGYDPRERGTFFGRLMARIYYQGRALRVLRGYAGEALSAYTVSHYVIDSWEGPNADGRVSIVAKDVLNLVDGDRAVAPAPTTGKLEAGIDASALAFTLTPAGIGDLEYPSEGRVTVGREIMRFTRSGDDITVVERAVDGTEAASHDAGDSVQVALRYEDQRLDQVVADLLSVQGPVDPAFIDSAAWQEEVTGWIAGTFTATIPKPTAIAQLVGELCQHGAQVWWDEVGQEIRLRSNRPRLPDEAVAVLTDAANLLRDSVSVARVEDQRISTLFFYHGMLDPTDSVESVKNYARVAVASDPSSASANETGEKRIKEIYSRWLGAAGSDAAASVVAERLVSRYRNTPRHVTAALDRKDSLDLADLIEVRTFVLTDDTGEVVPVPMQVNRVVRGTDRLQFTAEERPEDLRFGFIMDSALVEDDYDLATAAEKKNYAYIFDETEPDFGDANGPYLIF